MKRLFWNILGATLGSMACSALAQEGPDTICARLLEPDLTYLVSDDRLRLSYFDSLDSTSYDTFKSNLSGASSLLVDGIPVTSSMDFGLFKEKLNQEKQVREYKYSHDNSTWYYATQVPADRSQKFIDCIGKFRDNVGLQFTVDRITDDSVSLILRWFPDRGSVRAIKPEYRELRGGSRSTSYPKVLEPFKEYYFSFKRAPTTDFQFVVQGAGRVAVIFAPKPLILKSLPTVDPVVEALNNGFVCYVQFPSAGDGVDDVLYNIGRGWPYSINYEKATGKYYVTGQSTLSHAGVTAAFQGPEPKSHVLKLWSNDFQFDEQGVITSLNNTSAGRKLVGKITCSATLNRKELYKQQLVHQVLLWDGDMPSLFQQRQGVLKLERGSQDDDVSALAPVFAVPASWQALVLELWLERAKSVEQWEREALCHEMHGACRDTSRPPN